MNSNPRYSNSLHLLSFLPRLKTRPAELTANTVSPGLRLITNYLVFVISSLSMSNDKCSILFECFLFPDNIHHRGYSCVSCRITIPKLNFVNVFRPRSTTKDKRGKIRKKVFLRFKVKQFEISQMPHMSKLKIKLKHSNFKNLRKVKAGWNLISNI